MALRVESKTIGDHEYQVRQLNAVQGRNVFLRFAKLVAPALKNVAGGEEETTKKGVSKENFLSALGEVVANVTEEDQTFFCDVFAASTDVVIVDPVTGVRRTPKLSGLFLLHFAGDELPRMYEWLLFCFEVNFGSFFAKLGVTRGSTEAPKTA